MAKERYKGIPKAVRQHIHPGGKIIASLGEDRLILRFRKGNSGSAKFSKSERKLNDLDKKRERQNLPPVSRFVIDDRPEGARREESAAGAQRRFRRREARYQAMGILN